jgi:hypothetical protein
MNGVILCLALLIAGCAVPTKLVPVEYQFLDNQDGRRIELAYKNFSHNTMCLLPEQWPNVGGKIDQEGGTIFLIAGGERFALQRFNTGYCPNGCATRVVPGEVLHGYLPYEDFKLPERLFNEPKKLEFSPTAFRCKSK